MPYLGRDAASRRRAAHRLLADRRRGPAQPDRHGQRSAPRTPRRRATVRPTRASPPMRSPGKSGVVPGAACVYPVQALTVVDQIAAGGLTWRAYVEGMENEFGAANCVHPDFDGPDVPEVGAYAAARNPFVYFAGLLDLTCSGQRPPAGRARQGPQAGGDDAQLRLHRTRPLQRRRPRPVRGRGLRLGRRPGDSAGPADDSHDDDLPADAGADEAAERAAAAASADGFLASLGAEDRRLEGLTQARRSRSSRSTRPTRRPTSPRPGAGRDAAALAARPEGHQAWDPYDPYSVLRSTAELFGVTPLAKASRTESFCVAVAGRWRLGRCPAEAPGHRCGSGHRDIDGPRGLATTIGRDGPCRTWTGGARRARPRGVDRRPRRREGRPA